MQVINPDRRSRVWDMGQLGMGHSGGGIFLWGWEGLPFGGEGGGGPLEGRVPVVHLSAPQEVAVLSAPSIGQGGWGFEFRSSRLSS